MLREDTGRGVGYTKFRQLLIIKNETTCNETTMVGLDVEASANATFKAGDYGGSRLHDGSFNPYLEVYVIIDAGIDLQANWGGVELLQDRGLNKGAESGLSSPGCLGSRGGSACAGSCGPDPPLVIDGIDPMFAPRSGSTLKSAAE
jgi:hypothetical protein